MPVRNRRKKRRGDGMNFAYSGPFSAVLTRKPRVPKTDERYVPDSPESYRIGDYAPVALLDLAKPKRKRRRRGGHRVAS